MVKVSICVPTYKQTQFLKKNLESILTQDFQDYEVVITDDTPGEEVKDFVKLYESQFSGKLKYFKNQERLGSPENWNESIRRAQGEYIKILHHDDWFTSTESLRSMVMALEESGCYWLFCSTQIENERGFVRCTDHSKLDSKLLYEWPDGLLLANIIGGPSTTLIKKQAIETFDVSFKWLVDVEFYIRLIKNHKEFICLREVLVATISEASHAITSQIEDINIEFSENMRLFQKLGFSKTNKGNLFLHFLYLFRKYNVGLNFLIRNRYYHWFFYIVAIFDNIPGFIKKYVILMVEKSKRTDIYIQ